MTKSASFLQNWADRDFWETGAFLCSDDGQEVLFGKGGNSMAVDRFLTSPRPVFYLKDFFSPKYLAYSPAEFVVVSRDVVIKWLEKIADSQSDLASLGSEDDLYEKDFQRLKQSFVGGLQKVVLISRETFAPFSPSDTSKTLLKKAFTFGTGTPYGLWESGRGVIGSTPELLFNIQGERLRTFALAGTARKGQEEELLRSPKDRYEHDLVVTDIREKLAIFSTAIRVGATHLLSYKSLVHLKTDIEASVSPDLDLTALTNLMSPTAALGGYPKDLALRFLQETEYAMKYPRRTFGSAFGVVTPERQQFVVSIRNVQWEGSHLFIESGGGVVEASEQVKEVEEFRLKRNTIRKHYL
jgi:isochorismate synthase EntC